MDAVGSAEGRAEADCEETEEAWEGTFWEASEGVVVDEADGVEAGEGAADEADASVAAAGGSVSAGASVRPADDEGEPGAASVIGPILEVNPVQALLRREDPRV